MRDCDGIFLFCFWGREIDNATCHSDCPQFYHNTIMVCGKLNANNSHNSLVWNLKISIWLMKCMSQCRIAIDWHQQLQYSNTARQQCFRCLSKNKNGSECEALNMNCGFFSNVSLCYFCGCLTCSWKFGRCNLTGAMICNMWNYS